MAEAVGASMQNMVLSEGTNVLMMWLKTNFSFPDRNGGAGPEG
jgi:hypothetical protein